MRFPIRHAALALAILLPGAALADQASAHYHKALALKRQGKVDQAIGELKKALEQREDYAAAHYSIGVLYRQKNEHSKALFHLEKAVRSEPKNAQAHYSLGLAYFQAGRKGDALLSLKRAAELDPKNHQIQHQVGVLLIRSNPKGAIPYLEAAVKAKPDEPDYLHQLGLAYRRAGNLKRAEGYMLQAAAKKEDAKIEFDLGVLYRRMTKPFKAIERYEKAIRLDPKLAPAYWDVAHMYSQAKRPDDAVKAFESYLRLRGDGKDADIARKRIKELKRK